MVADRGWLRFLAFHRYLVGLFHWVGQVVGRRASVEDDDAAHDVLVGGAETTADDVKPKTEWPEPRLRLSERLWGEGFLTPGGEALALDVVRLMGLSSAHSLLHLGAELGGAGRAWTREYGIWVTGLERLPELVEIGQERSLRVGMGRKASVARFDPDKIDFKNRKYNAVVAFEKFFTVEDKPALFKAIEQALRIDGHLWFTDFVLPNAQPPNEIVRDWFGREPLRPRLWTFGQVHSHLKELAFDVRVVEDVTAQYRNRVLTGWLQFLSSTSKAELLADDFITTVLSEVEFWMHRLAALDSGGLKVFRFHALRIKEKGAILR